MHSIIRLRRKRENINTFHEKLQNKKEKLPSNLKGDGLQNGGTLVVTKGGTTILLDFRQDNPADHVKNENVLKALGIAVPQDFLGS
jgi:hypothetical protein